MKGGDSMKKECQCGACGKRVDFLLDDGICEECFKEKE